MARLSREAGGGYLGPLRGRFGNTALPVVLRQWSVSQLFAVDLKWIVEVDGWGPAMKVNREQTPRRKRGEGRGGSVNLCFEDGIR